jgi:zinc transport system substrate-binding protein
MRFIENTKIFSMKSLFFIIFILFFYTNILNPVFSKEIERSKNTKDISYKKSILVSVLPIKFVLNNILSKNTKYYNIEVILKAGVEHHDIDLSPNLIKKLNSFNYILTFNSLGIEKLLLKKVDKNKLIVLYNDNYLENDHHVWLSLKNLKKIYLNTYNLLYNIDKNNYKYYKENLDKVIAKIELYNTLLLNKTKNYKGKYILTYHNEYYYFAKDYNLNIISLQYNDESEISLKDIQKITDLIKQDKISFILTSGYYDNSIFFKLLDKANKKIKIIVCDPFSEDTINIFWKIYSNI